MQCCYVLYNTSFLIMIMSRIQRKRTFITKTVGTNINRFDLKNTRGGQGPGASRPVFIFRCSFAKFTLCKWQNCQANHFYLTASFISDYLHWSPYLSFFAIFLAVQDSSIGDLVTHSLIESDFWFQRQWQWETFERLLSDFWATPQLVC